MIELEMVRVIKLNAMFKSKYICTDIISTTRIETNLNVIVSPTRVGGKVVVFNNHWLLFIKKKVAHKTIFV
jgi:hypothetical protein